MPNPLANLTDVELNQLTEAGAQLLERIWAPSDEEVIGQMVRDGCPRRDAEQQMKHRGLSYYARQYYVDAQDALAGDPEATTRVEAVREAWGKLSFRREMQR